MSPPATASGAAESPTLGCVITSVDNPRVKEVLRLRKGRERRRTGLFVAEGRREVERAAAAGLSVVTTYFAPALIAWDAGGEEVSERVLAKMAYRAEPEGVLAVVEAPRHDLPANGTLYLAAVAIEKPGNLGALARTAAAAGADALLVAEAQADPWNPNAIRASTGAVFTLPVVEATLDDVRALPVQLVATATDATTSYTDADLDRPIAVAVGAEDAGLPHAWLDAADLRVTIPLAATATDSLNAATAAAVVLFEARRQRADA
jgi:RNA methyltransferase, TrmH family